MPTERHGLHDGDLADPGASRVANGRRTRTLGAISFAAARAISRSMPDSEQRKPVTLPPGRDRLVDEADADRIGDRYEHDRYRASCLLQRDVRDVRPLPAMTSGASETNSAALRRKRS